MLGVVLSKLCLHVCVSILFSTDKLARQVLVCLPIGWVEVLEVLRMLDAQVLVCISVGMKCSKFCCWMKELCYTQYAIPSFRQVGHPGTSVPAYWLC